MDPIDPACEKAMIQFIYYHKAARIADLDTVWKEFLQINPLPEAEDDEVDMVCLLKLHYLCMDRSRNDWELEEDMYLYFKYGEDMEEFPQAAEEPCPDDEEDSGELN